MSYESYMNMQHKKLSDEEKAQLPELHVKTFNWRITREGDEFISADGYQKSYMNPKSGGISQAHLDVICEVTNAAFEAMKSRLRVANSMGEIIPATVE